MQTLKELHFDREKLFIGIDKMYQAVSSTYGACGRTVLMESENHTKGLTVTKDGVTVAKNIALIDPVENLAVRILLEASQKTADLAGDGTTTAIVLARSLIYAAKDFLSKDYNTSLILKYLREIADSFISEMQSDAIQVSDDMLYDVAKISSNDDELIAKMVSELYSKVGSDGIVTTEKSKSSKTYSETTEGITINRGYTSPLFINDKEKEECVYEDVHVLVCDAEITSILQIENVLKPITASNKKFLLIAPASPGVVRTMSANVVKNSFKWVNIAPPSFGYRKNELMQDIATAIGATYFSEQTGDDLSLISESDLGFAKRVIISKDKTVIVRDKSIDISEHIDTLKKSMENTSDASIKDFIKERIASLVSSIGVIYVGGNTDLEQKELYDRFEDAVCAVRSAIEEGVVPGAGTYLANIAFRLSNNVDYSKLPTEKQVAYDIIKNALLFPMIKIVENAHLDGKEVVNQYYYRNRKQLFNVLTRKWEDIEKTRVLDPVKVTRCALDSAISVAMTVLSTDVIVTIAREK